jgi:hypothetical protein
LLYYLVFPAKYRRAVIDPQVDEILRDVCLQIEDRYQLKFLEIGTLRARGPSLDPAGTAVAGAFASGVLFDPLGATFDGTDGVQHSLQVVYGSGPG